MMLQHDINIARATEDLDPVEFIRSKDKLDAADGYTTTRNGVIVSRPEDEYVPPSTLWPPTPPPGPPVPPVLTVDTGTNPSSGTQQEQALHGGQPIMREVVPQVKVNGSGENNMNRSVPVSASDASICNKNSTFLKL